MLKSQYRRRYEHRHLFAVGGSLECGTDSHFGLAKTYIAADKSIHRLRALHIRLDVGCSFRLVGRIFVDKRRLKLCLQITVGRIFESLLFEA